MVVLLAHGGCIKIFATPPATTGTGANGHRSTSMVSGTGHGEVPTSPRHSNAFIVCGVVVPALQLPRARTEESGKYGLWLFIESANGHLPRHPCKAAAKAAAKAAKGPAA